MRTLETSLATLLAEVKACLASRFGERLQYVILYGSRARGDAEEDSDVDLMVVLEPPVELFEDIQSITGAIYPLQLRTGLLLQALPVPCDVFERGEFAIYRAAKAEGIVL